MVAKSTQRQTELPGKDTETHSAISLQQNSALRWKQIPARGRPLSSELSQGVTHILYWGKREVRGQTLDIFPKTGDDSSGNHPVDRFSGYLINCREDAQRNLHFASPPLHVGSIMGDYVRSVKSGQCLTEANWPSGPERAMPHVCGPHPWSSGWVSRSRADILTTRPRYARSAA